MIGYDQDQCKKNEMDAYLMKCGKVDLLGRDTSSWTDYQTLKEKLPSSVNNSGGGGSVNVCRASNGSNIRSLSADNVPAANNNFCPLLSMFSGGGTPTDSKRSPGCHKKCKRPRKVSRCRSMRRRRKSKSSRCGSNRGRRSSSTKRTKRRPGMCGCKKKAKRLRRCEAVCGDKAACKKCKCARYKMSPYAAFVKSNSQSRSGMSWCKFVKQLSKKWHALCSTEKAKYYRKVQR